ncbi:MAG: ferredoxin [Thermodesulfobacteriota bacterium]
MARSVFIDVYECNGCGSCVEICPEVFRMNDTGDKAELVIVDPEITDKVEEAVAYCAQKCILLE